MSNEKQNVALSSMAASFLMALGKFVVGLSTGSLGILSEALHSLLDFAATILTYMAVRVSDHPADAKHPYGHGKIESVAALAETALLFLTSFWIIYEAIHRLILGKYEVEATWWSVGVIVTSIVIDISRSRALSRVAKKTNSQALEADALHFQSDVYSSTVVLIGLCFVAMGWPIGDPIAAIGVSLFVCHAGWELGRRTIDTLIDTAPQGAYDKISAALERVEGLAGVKRVRVRPAGSVSFVDIDVNIGRGLSLTRAETLRDDIIAKVKEGMPEAEVSVTTTPLALDNETIMQRVLIIAAHHNAAIHHVTIHHPDGKLAIGLDLEIDGSLSLHDAHEVATKLEADMRTEFGQETEVDTHIDPLQDHGLEGVDVEAVEREAITTLLGTLAQERSKLSDVHKVRVRKTEMGLIVMFHCRANPELSVIAVHDMVDALEKSVRKAYPGIWRIVGHAEPIKPEAVRVVL